MAKNWRSSDLASERDVASPSRKITGISKSCDLPAPDRGSGVYHRSQGLPHPMSLPLHGDHKGMKMAHIDLNQLLQDCHNQGNGVLHHSRFGTLTKTYFTAQSCQAKAKEATQLFLFWCSLPYHDLIQTQWHQCRASPEVRWRKIPWALISQWTRRNPDEDDAIKCEQNSVPRPEALDRRADENRPTLATNLESGFIDLNVVTGNSKPLDVMPASKHPSSKTTQPKL